MNNKRTAKFADYLIDLSKYIITVALIGTFIEGKYLSGGLIMIFGFFIGLIVLVLGLILIKK